MKNFLTRLLGACALAAGLCAGAIPAHAAVTASLSAGASCGGSASANFVTGGSPVQVSLCVSSSAEPICGATVQFQSASAAESGRFFVTGATLAAAFPDANAAALTFPVAVANPPSAVDLGGTTNAATPTAAAANILVATYTLTPQANATNNSYVVSLGGFSSAASHASNCLSGNATDVSLSASFTLNRVASPTITSVSSTTFAINTFGTFTVTATGSPAPTLALAGFLPSGVTFTPATGVLSGSPALGTVGVYNLTVTATNAGGTDTRNFTLTVVKADQTIAFAGPANQSYSPAPIALTASASSGLPVTLASNTPTVCSVSGTTLTMLTAGTCTVLASQAGSPNYNAAPTVTQSFTISAVLPGAPTITAAAPGNGAATLSFNPPANYGGTPITAYTATCAPGAITGTSASSPVIVSGLANGTAYTCSVTATNAVGTGPASAPVGVTPTAAATPPTIASPSGTAFTVNAPGTFTIIAAGTPAPTLSMSGRLPVGVAFNAATGALSGTPVLGSVGDYALSIVATNASGSATQSFTLSVVKANQTITFAGPANQGFSATPIPLTATSTSGLAVAFSSATPSVCSVSGASLTMLAAGTCTVLANQAGDVNYNPAPTVTRSFTIASGVPGAPVIGTATAFSGAALVNFSAPASNGGAPITAYTVTCAPGGFTATGTGSPLTVSGLANGTAYACSVTASNANGTGPASASVNVTPSVTRTFSGPSATGTGIITATFTGGGATCGFTRARFIDVTGDPASPPAGSAPPGVTFPHGLFDFAIGGCTPGASIAMTITYPSALPSGTLYWKYGPRVANPSASWYVLPANVASTVATFTIPDGGLGDDDLLANGTLVDQGGPGVGSGAEQIPTLGEWAMILLGLLLVGFGMLSLRTRMPGRP